jgi:hypothetical protein
MNGSRAFLLHLARMEGRAKCCSTQIVSFTEFAATAGSPIPARARETRDALPAEGRLPHQSSNGPGWMTEIRSENGRIHARRSPERLL